MPRRLAEPVPQRHCATRRQGEVTTLGDRYTAGFGGLLPNSPSAESVLGGDDRARITPTTGFPWRTVCKLIMTFPGGTYIGSGAMIGRTDGNSFHVLTAGHCVYSSGDGGWATSIRVIPAYDDGYMPYSFAWATFLRSYTGWTVSGDSNHDWAVITLDRRVGNYTGWMGRITRDASSWIYTTTLNSAGYPGDLMGGEALYFDSDVGRVANTYKHWYYMDTAGGQSFKRT